MLFLIFHFCCASHQAFLRYSFMFFFFILRRKRGGKLLQSVQISLKPPRRRGCVQKNLASRLRMKCSEKKKNSTRQRQAARLFFFHFVWLFLVFSRSICVLCSSLCHEWTGCVGVSMERLICFMWVKKRQKKPQLPVLDFKKSKIDKLSLKVFLSLRKLYFGPQDVFLKGGGCGGGGSQNRSSSCDLLLSLIILRNGNACSPSDRLLSDTRPMPIAEILAHF